MKNKKSIWSKITGLSEDELEMETWQDNESWEIKAPEVKKNALIQPLSSLVDKEADVEETIFSLAKEENEKDDESSFLNIDESWALDTDGQLAIDVYRDGDNVVVKSAIAGVKQKDLEITIASDTVTISGSRAEKDKIKDKDYFYHECYWGKFSRSVVLPFDIDEARSKANLEDGILTVILPIVKEEQKTKIKIKEKK